MSARNWVPVGLLLFALTAFVAVVGADRGSAAEDPPARDSGVSTGPAGGVDETRIVVRYRASASPGAVRQLESSEGVGGRKVLERSGLTILELPSQANPQATLARLRASALVEEAGFAWTVGLFDVPDDPGYVRQWHLHNTDGGLRAEAAWSLAPAMGAGVVVAVIDTGVAYEAHTGTGPFGAQTFAPAPDLAGVPIVAPWDFIGDDGHANDDHGHGTHVAGTILQATNNGIGVSGVAPGASLMPLKILDYAGSGDGPDLVEAIYYAVEHGADVINMSLGFPTASNDPAMACSEAIGLGEALEFALSQGVVLVAATGNDGSASVSCPAAHPAVMAVGSTRFDGQVAFYSNRGPAISVAAPGGDPLVDQNGDGYGDGVLQQSFCLDAFFLALTGNYTQFCEVYKSGTSMAAPHVAGVVALLLGEDGSLTPSQVRQFIEATARDQGPAGWDEGTGWGIVDAVGAVAMLKGVPIPEITPPPTPTPTPVPATPTDLVATAVSASTIHLTWTDNATDEQYYRIERSMDGVAFSQVAMVLADATSWTNYNLQPDTTYHYRVRASQGTVYSEYSGVAAATTLPPPASPTGLTATTVSESRILLSWTDNATDEQYFRVERSADGVTFTQVAVLGANTTSWTNTNLQPETTYHYRVRASAGLIYSGYSNTATATTLSEEESTPALASPTNLTATAPSSTSIQLAWTDNASDEQYYRVERSADGVTFSQVAVLGANTTTWTNTSLTPGATYWYRVRASQGLLYSEYSNTASATTLPPPAAPTGLSATALSPTSIQLSWTDNATDEQYYRVERSADGMTFSQVAQVAANTTTWTNSNLQAETTYHYRVRASVGLVYSGYSNTASATTEPPPPAPSDLTATQLTATSVRLTWTDNATNEQYYRVERSSDGVTFTQVAVLSANTTAWTNYSLQPGTTYHYRVRASIGTVYSEYSNVAVVQLP